MNYKAVPSVCPYCGCGCGLYLEVMDGHLVGTFPSPTHPISRGSLCIKGWSAYEFVESEARLTRPLWKRGANLEPTDWNTVLYFVAERLKAIRDRYGPRSIGFLSSAKCTNEENYVFMKFARSVVGTNNIDHCARLCHAPTVAGLAYAFGSGAMTNSVPELEEASCILVIGSNTTENHPHDRLADHQRPGERSLRHSRGPSAHPFGQLRGPLYPAAPGYRCGPRERDDERDHPGGVARPRVYPLPDGEPRGPPG